MGTIIDPCRGWPVSGPEREAKCFKKLRCKKCTEFDPVSFPSRSRFHIGLTGFLNVQKNAHLKLSNTVIGTGAEVGWHLESAKLRRNTEEKKDTYLLTSERYFIGIKTNYLHDVANSFQAVQVLFTFDYSYMQGKKQRIYGSGFAAAPIVFLLSVPRLGMIGALTFLKNYFRIPSFELGFTKVFGQHPLNSKTNGWQFNLKIRLCELGLQIHRFRFGIDTFYQFTRADKKSFHDFQMITSAKYVF